MSLSMWQVIIRTFVTTVDLLLTLAVIKAGEANEGMIKAFVVLVMINLMGVWI